MKVYCDTLKTVVLLRVSAGLIVILFAVFHQNVTVPAPLPATVNVEPFWVPLLAKPTLTRLSQLAGLARGNVNDVAGLR